MEHGTARNRQETASNTRAAHSLRGRLFPLALVLVFRGLKDRDDKSQHGKVLTSEQSSGGDRGEDGDDDDDAVDKIYLLEAYQIIVGPVNSV